MACCNKRPMSVIRVVRPNQPVIPKPVIRYDQLPKSPRPADSDIDKNRVGGTY